MKKVIIFSAIIALFSISCSKDDSAFDKSADERIEQIWRETEQTLCAAPNGWSMDFFYGQGSLCSQGGIRLFMKFDNGTVTVASELNDNDYTATSLYSYTHDVSATINFDTYNDILHAFSTPSKPNVLGDGGDFEFVIMETSPERVVLRGKRTYLQYVLTPLQEDQSWADQFAQYKTFVFEMDKKMPSYVINADGSLFNVERVVENKSNVRRLVYTPEDGEGEAVDMPFIYTTEGLRFYAPVTLGGITFQNFNWDGDHFIDYDTNTSIEKAVR